MTAQTPDILIFEGREVSLLSNPLEAFWDDTHPRPRFIPRSTGLWRGYVATWLLENDRLSLVRVEGSVCVDESGGTVPASLQLVFPGMISPIPATWFTGELRIPEGECVEYVHMGYASVYEQELLLRINRGIVASSQRIETGKKRRREVESLLASREQPRPATQHMEGWIVCPHCRVRFTIRGKGWDGERHSSCGGRISLEG